MVSECNKTTVCESRNIKRLSVVVVELVFSTLIIQ